jgi:hypothetical protein
MESIKSGEKSVNESAIILSQNIRNSIPRYSYRTYSLLT